MLIHAQANCLNARTALLATTLVALSLLFSLAAEQEPKPAVAAVLHGRVRDEAGEPLAGVRVRVAIPGTDMRFAIRDDDHKQFEAISGDNGGYRLEIPGITKPTTISVDAMLAGHSTA